MNNNDFDIVFIAKVVKLRDEIRTKLNDETTDYQSTVERIVFVLSTIIDRFTITVRKSTSDKYNDHEWDCMALLVELREMLFALEKDQDKVKYVEKELTKILRDEALSVDAPSM